MPIMCEKNEKVYCPKNCRPLFSKNVSSVAVDLNINPFKYDARISMCLQNLSVSLWWSRAAD